MTSQASRFSAAFLGNFRLTAALMLATGAIWLLILLISKKPTVFNYFNAVSFPLLVLPMWWLQRRLAAGPALWLEGDTLIYKQGAFTRRISCARIARIRDDGQRLVLLDEAGERITSFNRKHYDDLSWLSALKPAADGPATSNNENESMKKPFLIAFGVSFGVAAAVLLSAIVLYSMGGVRRDILGNWVIVPGSTSSGSLDDYEKRAAATKALVISEVKWVRQGEGLAITFAVKNTMDYVLDDLVTFQLVFLRGDDLKGVITELESIVVPANGTAQVVLQLRKDTPAEFDVLRISPK